MGGGQRGRGKGCGRRRRRRGKSFWEDAIMRTVHSAARCGEEISPPAGRCRVQIFCSEWLSATRLRGRDGKEPQLLIKKGECLSVYMYFQVNLYNVGRTRPEKNAPEGPATHRVVHLHPGYAFTWRWRANLYLSTHVPLHPPLHPFYLQLDPPPPPSADSHGPPPKCSSFIFVFYL